MLTTMRTDLRQMNGIPEVIGAMYDCRTVWGFPQIDYTAVDWGAVELDVLTFRRTSFPPVELSAGRDRNSMEDYSILWGFPQIDSAAVDCDTGAVELDDLIFCRTSFPLDKLSAGRDGDYIWLTLLAGLSVRTRSVTGSLPFGSPHRLGRSCLWLAALSLSSLDRECGCSAVSSSISAVSRNASHEVEMYFLPPCFRLILTISYYFYRFFRERDIASGRSPDRAQVDPFLHAPTRSAKLYDFAPDIQDAMELQVLRPHARLVKVISVWNSRGSRMMTASDLALCGWHEFLLHVVGEAELLFMMTGELDCIRRVRLRASFAFLTKYQQDLKYTRTVCRVRAGYTHSENCTIGGNYIQTDFGQHIAFCHLEIVWRCYCLCVWCTLLQGIHTRRMFYLWPPWSVLWMLSVLEHAVRCASVAPVVKRPGRQAQEFSTCRLSRSLEFLSLFRMSSSSPAPARSRGDQRMIRHRPFRLTVFRWDIRRNFRARIVRSVFHRFHRESSFSLHEGAHRLRLEMPYCRHRQMTV